MAIPFGILLLIAAAAYPYQSGLAGWFGFAGFVLTIGGILSLFTEPKKGQASSQTSELKLSACQYAINGRCTGTPDLIALRGSKCKNPVKDACCILCNQKNQCEISCEFATSSQGWLEPPPPPPSPPVEPTTKALEDEIAELKRQLAEKDEALNSISKAYEQLEITVKELEEELKKKDEIISKLEGEKTGMKAEKIKHTTEQERKKPPMVRLVTFDIDLTVYDYIISHGGTINLQQACRDLGITPKELREAIQRLKRAGKIAET